MSSNFNKILHKQEKNKNQILLLLQHDVTTDCSHNIPNHFNLVQSKTSFFTQTTMTRCDLP